MKDSRFFELDTGECQCAPQGVIAKGAERHFSILADKAGRGEFRKEWGL